MQGPERHRWQRRCTAAYSISFVGLGMMMSVLGPALPPLADRLGLASSSALSAIFIARGCGYFAGTASMGVLLDRFQSWGHRMMAAFAAVLALAGGAVPHAGSVAGVVALVGVLSVAGGAIDVGGNILLVHVWGEDQGAASAMNFLHASWGMGSTLAPLVAGGVGLTASRVPGVFAAIAGVSIMVGGVPLLLEPPQPPSPGVHATPNPAHGSGAGEGEDGRGTDDKQQIQISDKAQDERLDTQIGVEAPPAATVPRTRFCLGILAMFLFYFAYAAAEHLPGDWITSVAMNPAFLGVTENDGAFATAAFWGSLLVGRLLAVPVAWYVSSSRLLAFEFALSIASAVLFVAWGGQTYTGLLVSCVGLGLGLAALYPSGIVLAKQRLLPPGGKDTGRWISAFICGGLVSSMGVPAVVGYQLETHPGALGWSLLAAVLLQAGAFLAVAGMPPLAADGGGTGGAGGGDSPRGAARRGEDVVRVADAGPTAVAMA